MMLSARRRGRLSLLLVLGVAVLLVALRPAPAAAHAQLAQSDPPAQSSVTQAPSEIRLFFTETVEPRSIEVSVLDRDRKPVDRGDARLVPGTEDTVVASLGTLPPGLYTISWKVTSTVDGHTTRGLVPFSVGDAGAVPEPLSAQDIGRATSEESTVQSGPLGIIARWLLLVALLGLGGLLASGPLLVRPTYRHLQSMANGKGDVAVAKEVPRRVATTMLARIRRLCWLALALFGAGSAVLLLVDAAAFADSTMPGALGQPVLDLLQTRRGVLWAIRSGLGIALAGFLVVVLFREGGTGRPQNWWIAVGLVAGMLLMTSLGSHSAALRTGAALATAIDWVHQLAVSLWVGGLVALGLALLPALQPLTGPARTRLLAGLVPRFSRLALASVVVIILTGLYQTWQLLDGARALTELTWGQALVLKLALVVVLIGLGAVNLLFIRPRLAKYTGRADRATRERAAELRLTFRRVVVTEAALGALILLLVGVLTGTTPSRAIGGVADGPFRPFILEAAAEDLTGRLVLSPGRIGNNRFDVSVQRSDGAALPADTTALLRIFTLDQDTGIAEATLQPLGGGRFTTTGSYLSTVGLWEVAAVVRRPGFDDVTLPFRLSLTESTGRPQTEEARPAAPLARGREIYQQSCVQCHGVGGRGDGPLAAGLRPPPLDLTVHVPLHPDQDLVGFITNGVPRTAMQAWGGQFSPEEIQAIVNYLRELAQQSRQSR